jgi:hypothetical protein
MGARRQIGAIGTTARIVIGSAMLVFGALGGRIIVINWRPQLEWDWAALALGLFGFPALLLILQQTRLNRNASRLDETGPVAATLNILIFVILVSTVDVPPTAFIGFAAFVFYGASMLLAAVRGYSGCEVLAASNWLLRRDDQIGCLVLSPLDRLDQANQLRSGGTRSGGTR